MPSKNIVSRLSVRPALEQLVQGISEGIVLMQRDKTLLWANDAMLAMHGVKQTTALGMTLTDYRKQFQMRFRNSHLIKAGDYPLARALQGHFADDVVVELRRRGETDRVGIHRIRTLELHIEGSDAPLFAAIHTDLTATFEAEERFERTFAANPAPAFICRLSDLRIVRVNSGFLKMTGYARDMLVGSSVDAIDLFDDHEVRKMTSERLEQGDPIGQTESMLRMSDGMLKYVLMAGQPIDMGQDACMLLTFVDLDGKRKAESALKNSEELFSKAFRLAPVPMLVTTRDESCVLDANEAFLQTFGGQREEMLSRTLRELGLWRTPGMLRAFEQEISRSGSVRNQECQLAVKDEPAMDCLISAEIVTINDRACVLIALQDITERKRTETELISAIEAVMQDASWFSRTVIEKLAHVRRPAGSRPDDAALGDLTSRERDVLGALCQGLADAEIAQQLGIARNTVRNHISTLYEKIGVNRRASAIVWARERGFTGTRPRSTKK